MDYYEIWFDLASGEKDTEACAAVDRWLGHLVGLGQLEGYQITRRKLGFGPPSLPEFHVSIAVRDLAQLDQAFHTAASRTPDIEALHADVYRRITNYQAALYRDFPD